MAMAIIIMVIMIFIVMMVRVTTIFLKIKIIGAIMIIVLHAGTVHIP